MTQAKGFRWTYTRLVVGMSLSGWMLGCAGDFKSHEEKPLLEKIGSVSTQWGATAQEPLQKTRCPLPNLCRYEFTKDLHEKIDSTLRGTLSIFPVTDDTYWMQSLAHTKDQEDYRSTVWRSSMGITYEEHSFSASLKDSQSILQLHPVSPTSAWLANTKGRVFWMTDTTVDTYALPQASEDSSVSFCSNGPQDVWMIAKGAFAKPIEPLNRTLFHFNGQDWAELRSFSHPLLQLLCMDAENVWWRTEGPNSWSATKNRFVFRYQEGRIDVVQKPVIDMVGRRPDNVYLLYSDKPYYIWQSEPSKLVQYDGVNFVEVALPPAIQFVSSMWMDEQEQLWIGTETGVSVKTADGWKTVFSNNSLSELAKYPTDIPPNFSTMPPSNFFEKPIDWQITGSSSHDVWFIHTFIPVSVGSGSIVLRLRTS